jgi:hypothetical protein
VLDLDGELQHVGFSPDDARVAVSSVRQEKDQSSTFHLRIWDTATGKFVRELRPLYYFQPDGIGQPMWWGNGKYLLTQNRESHWGSYVTGIWNTETGMLRGEFSGYGYPYDCPVALVGRRLFEKYPDGKVQSWDVAAAVDQIESLENSLKPARAGR